MENYLIELAAVHMILTIGYWLFLRKERQYQIMRFFLVFSTLMALIIPLIKLPKLFSKPETAVEIVPMEVVPLDSMTIVASTDNSTWIYTIITWIYAIVAVFFLFKFISSVVYIIYLERKSTYEKFNDQYIRRVPNMQGSFSFFKWVFISDEIDKRHPHYDIILNHEKAHVSLGHSYDLLLFGLFKGCFWWLPSAWFINREIKKIHEYEADARALKSCDIDQYSSILISSTLKINGLSAASSFHDGLILKRLYAMKNKAKKIHPGKPGILSLFCVLLFIIFACSEEPPLARNDLENKDNSIVSENVNQADQVFTMVEEQAEYPEGISALYNYILREIKYPKEARIKGIEGNVFVQFDIDKDGSLSNITTVEGIGAGCDAEAERVLRNAAPFKPGRQRGKAVRTRMVLPVTFMLSKDKVNDDNSKQGIIALDDFQRVEENLKVDAKYVNGSWSGTIRDEQGKALPGANIVLVGTSTGTVSDVDGTFKLKTDQTKDLNISFIGYKSLKIKRK